MSLSRSLFVFRWFTYLLGRSSTSPTSKAWPRCWPLPRSVYFSKVINACKELLICFWRKCCLVSSCVWYFTGPRDHPDIAESFMHLHAQVNWIFFSVSVHICISQRKLCLVTLFFFRFLRGSLICTCPTSRMLKHCFTVVSVSTCLNCPQVILTDKTQCLVAKGFFGYISAFVEVQ